jgi:hypothetical protein
MEIKNFVKIFDDAIPLKCISNIIRYANNSTFIPACVGGGDTVTKDFTVRKAHTLALSNVNNSLTNVHWFNFLSHYFTVYLRKYAYDFKMLEHDCGHITNMEILKYGDTGFFEWHYDHFAQIPRTMSCILMLNNDYEGGNLCFRNPDGSGEWEIKVKPNRMIIWPSNFLFFHTVKPVIKGTRYSVVAWTL